MTEPPDAAALLDLLPDPVVVIDVDFRVVWASRGAEERFGWRLADLRGMSAAELVHPDDRAFAAASLVSVQQRHLGTPIELRLRDASGLYGRFELRGRSTGGQVILAVRDITDRRRWEVAGGDTLLLQAIIDNAPAITLLLDAHGLVRGASRAITSLLGHDVEHLLGRSLVRLAPDDDASTLTAELALAASGPGTRSFETRFRHADGERAIPMSLTAVNLLDDAAINGLVVTAVDIGPLFEARAQLEHLANHDPLTGLLNRMPFRARLERALTDLADDQSTVAVLFCDVDRFKSINDRFGHAVGDAVLTEVGRRLAAVTRSDDDVARFGGDEFVVLLRSASAATGHRVAARIRVAMERPVTLPDGALLHVGVSVGLATSRLTTLTDELLGAADAAMYTAKQQRRRGRSLAFRSVE